MSKATKVSQSGTNLTLTVNTRAWQFYMRLYKEIYLRRFLIHHAIDDAIP